MYYIIFCCHSQLLEDATFDMIIGRHTPRIKVISVCHWYYVKVCQCVMHCIRLGQGRLCWTKSFELVKASRHKVIGHQAWHQGMNILSGVWLLKSEIQIKTKNNAQVLVLIDMIWFDCVNEFTFGMML